MTRDKADELYAMIEAEQAAIADIIEDSKKLAARSDVLLSASRVTVERNLETQSA